MGSEVEAAAVFAVEEGAAASAEVDSTVVVAKPSVTAEAAFQVVASIPHPRKTSIGQRAISGVAAGFREEAGFKVAANDHSLCINPVSRTTI